MVVMSMLERHLSNSSLRPKAVNGKAVNRDANANAVGGGSDTASAVGTMSSASGSGSGGFVAVKGPSGDTNNIATGRNNSVTDYNLFRRRHIDTIVRNILIALKKPKDSEVSFVYHLISQLNIILQYQRRYLTVSESTYLDEIVTVPTLLKVVDTIASPEFVGWRCTGNYDSITICQELELRTLITGLRLLRWHGVKALSGDFLDRLIKKLPSVVGQRMPPPGVSNAERDGTIDYLLFYIRNFLYSLPESRTPDQILIGRLFHDFSAVSASASADLPDTSRLILGLSEPMGANASDWHVLYIELDDLLWNLSELYRRLNDPQSPKSRNPELDEAALHEVERLVAEQLERILIKKSMVDMNKAMMNGKAAMTPSTQSDANHWVFGILDLLQQLVREAMGTDALSKAYEIAVNVIRTSSSSNLKCKALDVLSQLTHRGVVAAVQVDSALRALNLDRKEYFNLLEQRDRSNARLLTQRRLNEQSEVQREMSIFKIPERGPEPLLPEPDTGGDPIATLRFRSRPSVSLPMIQDIDEWRTFITEMEMELECEGQKNGTAAPDLSLLTCGCMMSEAYAKSILKERDTCPNCDEPTSIKKPLEKLRRMYQIVTDKKMELGMYNASNHRFSVVISSPGGMVDDFSDGRSSELGGSSVRIPLEFGGDPAIPSPDNLVFGSPGQGGGFPKELPWENPSVKFIPEALEQLFGDRGLSTAHSSSPGGSSTPSAPSETFLPGHSRKLSRAESAGEPSAPPPPRKNFVQQISGQFRKGSMVSNSSDSKTSSPTSATRPNLMNQSQSGGGQNAPSLGVFRTNSNPLSPSPHPLELTRSLSPTRYQDPQSPPLPRFNGPHRSHTMDVAGSSSPASGQYSPLRSAPIMTGGSSMPFNMGRKPGAGSVGAAGGAQLQPQRYMAPLYDDDAMGEDMRMKLMRNPSDPSANRIAMWMDRNQSFPQETTVLRPPLDKDEETRQLSFNKYFPFFKAEYVHHIQTGSRLRFPDIVATSIAPNCQKFVLLEKKKFKVYSILSSDKMPELLCCGKSTGEYGSYLEPYNNISTEDKVIGKQLRWEYLMAACSNRFLAIAGTHGTLKVHDLSSDGKPIYSYVSESYDIRCMAISGDGQTVALGVVTVEHGKEISQIILHHIEPSPNSSGKSLDPSKVTLPYADPTGVLSFSDDSTYLACSTVRESRFLVYDLANQPPRLVMKSSRKLDISHDAEGITSVQFFPGNRLLCVTSVASGAPPIVVDSHIGVIDPNTGLPVNKISLVTRLNKVGDKVHGCCVSPTGQALCAIDKTGNILVVNFPHGLVNDEGRRPRVLKVAKVQGAVKMTESASIAFTPDGHRLIIVDRKADVTIVDFAEIDENKMTKSNAWE